MENAVGTTTKRLPMPIMGWRAASRVGNKGGSGQASHHEGGHVMSAEFQVQKAGLGAKNWTTVCRGSEAKAREIYQRQLRLYTVGRFRLLDAEGQVIAEAEPKPLFSDN